MPDTYALYTRPLDHENSQVDDPVPAVEYDKLVSFLNLFLQYFGLRVFLGGSRTGGVIESDWVDHPEAIARVLDPDWFPGLTLVLEVWVKTDDPGTEVSVRLVNEEGTKVGAASTPSDATDWTRVTLPVSLATGAHTHTLQIKGSNADAFVYAHGAELHAIVIPS